MVDDEVFEFYDVSHYEESKIIFPRPKGEEHEIQSQGKHG